MGGRSHQEGGRLFELALRRERGDVNGGRPWAGSRGLCPGGAAGSRGLGQHRSQSFGASTALCVGKRREEGSALLRGCCVVPPPHPERWSPPWVIDGAPPGPLCPCSCPLPALHAKCPRSHLPGNPFGGQQSPRAPIPGGWRLRHGQGGTGVPAFPLRHQTRGWAPFNVLRAPPGGRNPPRTRHSPVTLRGTAHSPRCGARAGCK